MKKLAVILLLLPVMAMNTHKRTKIIFFGDSITQMGINKGGYIDVLRNYADSNKLLDKYDLIGAGVGYNKIYDLYLRIDDDVINKKPDVVVIFEGVNDVGHKANGTGLEIEKYEKFYEAVIKKLQAKKIKLILVTPGFLGEKKDFANAQDSDLNAYCDVIRRLAVTYNCRLLDWRKIVMKYEQDNNKDNIDKGILTVDRIHPTALGNQMLAAELEKMLF